MAGHQLYNIQLGLNNTLRIFIYNKEAILILNINLHTITHNIIYYGIKKCVYLALVIVYLFYVFGNMCGKYQSTVLFIDALIRNMRIISYVWSVTIYLRRYDCPIILLIKNKPSMNYLIVLFKTTL